MRRPAHAQESATANHTAAMLPLVYEELRVLAHRHLSRERRGHTLQPTALVHEVYMRLAEQRQAKFDNKPHFFAAASNMIRRILVNYERQRATEKRGGNRRRVTLHDGLSLTFGVGVDLLALEASLEELARLDSRQARIVELKFFGGLTNRQVAEVLEVSTRTVEGEWAHARAWLQTELGGGDRE